ncbi:MarR family winged helix-turn-helix transcriptional regulator [Desertivibrio insolitus]|uniref:MarR family winged helix-turn-helix transcriptional regulator n=1 Tax=Herbiconiux sp. SYSU D00978 TaxID=2812562 RepID=UPI001A97956B|nr:MarR family transcriptional regulator [Herbiconiux sp. SYSU D00978]
MGTVVQLAREDADVAGVVERLRLAEARLHRRRQTICGPSEIDRAAVRFVYRAYDRNEPLTAKQLGQLLDISSAATTSLLDRLSGVGLVTRAPHPTDRRAIMLTPTDRRKDLDAIDPLSKQIAEAARELDREQSQAVRAFLGRVVDLVERECLRDG